VSRLLSSELLKLRTTRTFYAMLGGAVALIIIIAVLGAALGTFKNTGTPGRGLLAVAGLAPLFALVIGVMGVTTEFRHGTITPSLLVEPVRTRLMAAKLAAQLIAGAVCYAVCAGIVSVILSGRGIATGMSTSDWIEAVIGGAIATMLYAALGLGVGALLRNQVGAIVVVLAWVFVIENLLGIIPGGFGKRHQEVRAQRRRQFAGPDRQPRVQYRPAPRRAATARLRPVACQRRHHDRSPARRQLISSPTTRRPLALTEQEPGPPAGGPPKPTARSSEPHTATRSCLASRSRGVGESSGRRRHAHTG
jgi:ABC-2 type transport system permease protein